MQAKLTALAIAAKNPEAKDIVLSILAKTEGEGLNHQDKYGMTGRTFVDMDLCDRLSSLTCCVLPCTLLPCQPLCTRALKGQLILSGR